ncbi:MAG: YcxB family protein [Lachnospiraceae bacterium]|nr:YcxB family protein [Lachnospiraceae bacterium]
MSLDNNINEIKFKTKITKKELYEFIMNNNYKSLRGVISVLFSLIALVGMIYYWQSLEIYQKMIMIFFSCMFTIITPIEYYIRASRQVKKNFKEAITYIFNASGITINIKEESSTLPWEEVMKVISTKNLVIIYFTPIRAFILPKKDIGEDFEDLRELMETSTDCYKFVMK